MKKIAVIAIIVLLIGMIVGPVTASAGTKTDQYLGKREMCLETYTIKETRILDNQTILFIMRGGDYYINRLPVECTGLLLSDGFSYSTSIAKLCMQDSIRVLHSGSVSGSICPLGDFFQFKVEMSAGKAVTLLRDGLLEELVAEGAFKEAFPAAE